MLEPVVLRCEVFCCSDEVHVSPAMLRRESHLEIEGELVGRVRLEEAERRHNGYLLVISGCPRVIERLRWALGTSPAPRIRWRLAPGRAPQLVRR